MPGEADGPSQPHLGALGAGPDSVHVFPSTPRCSLLASGLGCPLPVASFLPREGPGGQRRLWGAVWGRLSSRGG